MTSLQKKTFSREEQNMKTDECKPSTISSEFFSRFFLCSRTHSRVESCENLVHPWTKGHDREALSSNGVALERTNRAENRFVHFSSLIVEFLSFCLATRASKSSKKEPVIALLDPDYEDYVES